MNNRRMGLIVIAMLIVSFGIGYTLSNAYQYFSLKDIQQKPVVNVEQNHDIITEDTQVVLEKEYTRCGHLVVSPFENKKSIIGKTLEELKEQYTAQNGFRITLYKQALIIRQTIDDWCPRDKEKCRLKDFKGMVAVYMGPDDKNDRLLRVTNIKISSLPGDLQKMILNGEYEFDNQQALNDALENLDEYL
ncbi:MAG: hypothetical protein ACOX6I_07080 [Syntrophomonadaceae bacterium]